MPTYPRLDIIPFGQQLLETRDLDPIYCALVDANFDDKLLANWLVAYWCLYHAGVSSWIAEQDDFWGALMLAAENRVASPVGGWPRGTERRHWRGKNAIESVESIRWKESTYRIVKELARTTLTKVMEEAQQYKGFGPWIGFKIADMVERVWDVPVKFDNAVVLMFDEPAKAADMVWKSQGHKGPPDRELIVSTLIARFADYKAPPRYDRRVNIQEIETILCKWKSHMNGHYPVGKDIREIRHGLKPWVEVSKTAKTFLKHMPAEVEQVGTLV